MLQKYSNSRRLLALVVLGGFLLVALTSLNSSNSVVGGFAIAVLGNCVSDAISSSLNK